MGSSAPYWIVQRPITIFLQIFKRIPPGGQNIPFNVHPESENKIDNERRAHRDEGDIDKPGTDTGSSNTHSLTYRRAHSEYLPLNEVLQSVHGTNL